MVQHDAPPPDPPGRSEGPRQKAFGVIDHEGSAGQDNASLHRIELDVAIEAIEEAGFIVEASSDVLDNPADDRTLKYNDESLGRNTDRILIRARRP